MEKRNEYAVFRNLQLESMWLTEKSEVLDDQQEFRSSINDVTNDLNVTNELYFILIWFEIERTVMLMITVTVYH